MQSQSDSAATQASGSTPANPYAECVTPMDLKVKLAEQRLEVAWKDGRHSAYALEDLRARCPCATCRTDREKRDTNPLHVLSADPTDVRVIRAEIVGNYAIRMHWSDGHDTGIFDFRFLRSLDAE